MSDLNNELEIYCNDKEKLSKAVTLLSDWGCCPRCVLRFLAEKQQEIYRKPLQEIKLWIKSCQEECTDAHGNKTTERNEGEHICVACLGILQEACSSDEFIRKLKAVSVEHDHEFDDYFVSLTIPVPLILREHAIWIILKEALLEVFTNSRNEDITTIKDAWKWVNGHPLGLLLGKPFDQRSPYEIAVTFVHNIADSECNVLYDIGGDIFRRRKNNKHGQDIFTRANVNKALSEITDGKFKRSYQCPPRILSSPVEVQHITCNHEAIFLAGRYNKYSRTLSQTPWVVDGARKSESSIEELICDKLLDKFRGKEYKFSSSGREDVDVLMLGTGRPFVVEMVDPHRLKFTLEQMKELQGAINASTKEIKVRDLQLVTREDVTNLKEGEEEKIKSYSAVCWSATPVAANTLEQLDTMKNINLKQKTPVRVLHRRALAIRERLIHSMTALPVDNQHFKLNLSTQAGTYIKEFVHGDFGRTQPSLGELLGVECDILELDVEGVELDWPRKIEEY